MGQKHVLQRLDDRSGRKSAGVRGAAAPTHLLVLSQTLLGLGELVALSLLGHGIIIVRSHGGRAGRGWRKAGDRRRAESTERLRSKRDGYSSCEWLLKI